MLTVFLGCGDPKIALLNLTSSGFQNSLLGIRKALLSYVRILGRNDSGSSTMSGNPRFVPEANSRHSLAAPPQAPAMVTQYLIYLSFHSCVCLFKKWRVKGQPRLWDSNMMASLPFFSYVSSIRFLRLVKYSTAESIWRNCNDEI